MRRYYNLIIDDWSVNRYNSNLLRDKFFLRIAETLNIDDYIHLTKNLCDSTRGSIRNDDAERVSNETEFFETLRNDVGVLSEVEEEEF